MLDHSDHFIGLTTPDGTVLEINKTALTFIGIGEADVLGRPFWETLWWTHSKQLQEQLREALKTAADGWIARFEVEYATTNGVPRYIDFSIKPVKDAMGKVILLVPEGRDVTDLKLAEQALRQSENTARALLNAPTDSFLLVDPQGVVLAANTVAAARLRKRVDEIVGRNVLDLYSARAARERIKRRRQAVGSRMPVRWEDEYQGRIYDHNLYPILDDHGEVSQVAIYIRDVTDYKQALARLEERGAELLTSEEKYRTLVENIPVMVYRMSPAGETIFVNHVVEDMFGYSGGDILGPPGLWYEKVHPEDLPRVEDLRTRSFERGEEFIAEYRVTHRDGYIVPVMDHAIPVRPAGGPVDSIDGFIIDMTGMVELQERLLRAGEIKTIAEVSARLAHEFRNPLVSVGGFARRLFSSLSPDDPNRARVGVIVREVDRMETILRMMLSYIEPLDLHVSLMDPNGLVMEALKKLESHLSERKMKVILDLAADLPRINVDGPRMERAFEVLMKNALGQMPEGGTLAISSSVAGRNFELILRYPVTSMSPDDVEHFFYPFTWTKTMSEVVDLPLAKILLNKLGGTIEATLTRPGELTLHLSLPC